MKRLLYAVLLMQSLQAAQVPFGAGVAPKDKLAVGQRIASNNFKTPENILYWGPKNSYGNAGIMHALFYPCVIGQKPNEEQFPLLISFMMGNQSLSTGGVEIGQDESYVVCGDDERMVELPLWVVQISQTGVPWANREEFLQDTVRVAELRTLLLNTKSIQVDYIFFKHTSDWPKISEQIPDGLKVQIQQWYEWLGKTANGCYAIVDYSMFKGSGLYVNERVKGQGWGLLHVLLKIPEGVTESNVLSSFKVAAAEVLLQLIKNRDYQNIQYFSGWMNRISSY